MNRFVVKFIYFLALTRQTLHNRAGEIEIYNNCR